jgi:hypothetical protein
MIPASPAHQHQTHGAVILCGKLKPARGGHACAAKLAHHRGKPTMPQSFLHNRQHIFVPAAFGIDQPVRRQAGLSERGSEQIALGHHPQHAIASRQSAGGNPTHEQSRSSVVGKAGSGAGNLVKGGNLHTAASDPGVHFGNTERKPI